MFNKIELNMREIGYGDTIINKNMKFLVKNFYNILLDCEKFNRDRSDPKKMFYLKYLKLNNVLKKANNVSLFQYFVKYQAFCFDLTLDSVLKGELKFKF